MAYYNNKRIKTKLKGMGSSSISYTLQQVA
ncbi:IS3 family transposase [Virgibacillus proomii]